MLLHVDVGHGALQHAGIFQVSIMDVVGVRLPRCRHVLLPGAFGQSGSTPPNMKKSKTVPVPILRGAPPHPPLRGGLHNQPLARPG